VRELERLTAEEPVHDDPRAEPRHLHEFLTALSAEMTLCTGVRGIQAHVRSHPHRGLAPPPIYKFPMARPGHHRP